jgi:hypothetical protein
MYTASLGISYMADTVLFVWSTVLLVKITDIYAKELSVLLIPVMLQLKSISNCVKLPADCS